MEIIREMIINYKKIFYYTISLILIFLIIYNWNFFSNIYKYNIFKENCIITKINNKSNKAVISKDEAVKFCDCKIKSLKKENIEIFVSKLRVENKLIAKEKIIDKECKKNLNIQNQLK
tara:strand:- start:130 stop:483 length:354 start_codon:yes stop_codon:yes gene_type:complete